MTLQEIHEEVNQASHELHVNGDCNTATARLATALEELLRYIQAKENQ